jgi:hypothetical protein
MAAPVIRADGFVAPCIPSLAPKPPAGPDWVHEIKHDGYRLIVRRDDRAVHLFTRRGYDWTDRYPAIAGAAGKLRARSFTLDGEAVVCGADGGFRCTLTAGTIPSCSDCGCHQCGRSVAGTLSYVRFRLSVSLSPRRRPRRITEMDFSNIQEVPGEPLAEPSQKSNHDEKPGIQIGTAANINANNFG